MKALPRDANLAISLQNFAGPTCKYLKYATGRQFLKELCSMCTLLVNRVKL